MPQFSPYGSEVHTARDEEWMVQNTFSIPRDQPRNLSSDFHYDENVSYGDWSREDGEDEDREGGEVEDWDATPAATGDDVRPASEGIEVVGKRQDLSNKPTESGWFDFFDLSYLWSPTNSTTESDKHRNNETNSATLTSYEVSLDEHSNDTDNKVREKKSRRSICGCCSPCRIKVLCALLSVAALVLIGVFAGRAIRERVPSSKDSDDNIMVPGSVPNPTKVDFPTSTPTAAPVTTLHPNYQGTESYPDYKSNITVGVYYYPWHGDNFHNGGGYIRNQLVPQQMPALGEYDDSEPETIAQHIAWSRQANIGVWVTSWWGPDKSEDKTTLKVIMEHEDIGDLKIALHYETTNRVSVRRDFATDRVVPDISHMCEHYFDHPNYYKINGRPVIVVYLTRGLESNGKLEEVALLMRTTAAKCGHSLYIVGDHVFEDPPDDAETFSPYKYLDAVTNYDVYGSMGSKNVYAGADVVDDYYKAQGRWRSQALSQNCHFVPAVSPGFNDRGVRLWDDHQALSRKLTKDSEPGSFFSYSLSKAVQLVDKQAGNLLLVNSFNEWHEDSQIEPVVGGASSIPELLTNGLEYEPYGDLYLNILREATSERV